MEFLTREPQRAAGAEPWLAASAPRYAEGRDQPSAAAACNLDHAVEKVLLYLRCLDLDGNAEVTRLLAQTVLGAERRLQETERADPAAILFEELHRLLPAGAAAGHRASIALTAPVPVPTPPPCPQGMTEQKLHYWTPVRALRDQVVALVELVFPRSRRYGQ